MSDPQLPIHAITILWGDRYTERDVNLLYSMIKRNTTLPLKFHLFSDLELPGLNQEIVLHSEPRMKVGPEYDRYIYRKTAGLCQDNLGGLQGERVFFFDIDVLIMDNLDDIFLYPKDDGFYIINDWNTKGDHVGQATFYSWVVGTMGWVRDKFECEHEAIVREFGTASQQYLSREVINKFGKLNFWPDEWFQSFRFHCLPPWPQRLFTMPPKPIPSTKVLAFHGCPDLEDALVGRWSRPGDGKAARGLKKLYKVCRPTPWIRDYWH